MELYLLRGNSIFPSLFINISSKFSPYYFVFTYLRRWSFKPRVLVLFALVTCKVIFKRRVDVEDDLKPSSFKFWLAGRTKFMCFIL